MKKIFITIGLFCGMTVCNLQAQNDNKSSSDVPLAKAELGLRLMPTFSSFNMQSSSGGTVKGEVTLGYGIGGLLCVNINKHVGIQLEAIYNSLSQKYKDQQIDREIKVKYLNIPLLVTFSTNKTKPVNFTAVMGPQMGYNIGASSSSSSGSGTDTLKTVFATKSSDFGFAYGAGVGFIINSARTLRFDLGFRGVYGLVNISKGSSANTGNSSYSIEKANVRTTSAYIGIALLF